MKGISWKLAPLRAPEDGAGAADAGAPGSTASGAAGLAGGGGAGGQQSAPDPFDRDFLPPDIRGAQSAEERFGKLADAWKGQRDREASRPQMPKTAAEYTFEPSEKIAPYFKNADDPLMGLAREAALKAGLPKDGFGAFVGSLYEAAAEAGLLMQPYDATAEGQKIAERIAPGKSWAEARPLVAQVVTDAKGFVDVMGEQMKLSDGAKGVLQALTDEAAGIEIISALSMALGKEPAFARAGTVAGMGWTKTSLDEAVKDPRYNPMAREYDKDFRAQVDAGFRQLYPS